MPSLGHLDNNATKLPLAKPNPNCPSWPVNIILLSICQQQKSQHRYGPFKNCAARNNFVEKMNLQSEEFWKGAKSASRFQYIIEWPHCWTQHFNGLCRKGFSMASSTEASTSTVWWRWIQCVLTYLTLLYITVMCNDITKRKIFQDDITYFSWHFQLFRAI